MNVLVLTSRPGYWKELAPDFATGSFTLACASSITELVGGLKKTPPVLVILDPDPKDGIQNIKNHLATILRANAMVHTAVISSLEEEEFHDAVEGFGVLLRIPPVNEAPIVRLVSEALRSVGVSV
jgi:hypothetical protein